MSQDSPLANLTQQLERPELFAHGDESLRDAALQAAKAVFDSCTSISYPQFHTRNSSGS